MRRFFLGLLIGSVSVSAIVGIIVMLIGSFGDFESRVLTTALTVTCTSILGLACGAAVENGRAKSLPLAGIALAVISALLWFVVIWSPGQLPEYLVRIIMSTTLAAIAISHVSLITLARLDARFKWSIYGVYVSVAGLTGILLSIIWFDDAVVASDLTMRALGTLAITVAALTIVIPVFHKLSSGVEEAGKIEAEIDRLRAQIEELEKRKEALDEKVEASGE